MTANDAPRAKLARFDVPLTRANVERFEALWALTPPRCKPVAVVLPEAGPGLWWLVSVKPRGQTIMVEAIARLTAEEITRDNLGAENARVDAARAAVDRAPCVGLVCR